ncbi:hypothetical protein HMPREF9214_1375 [Lactobacillus iners LactinV 11V1-d]|uniref:Uncharacterized protein n=1 Tax=Lactobacillus iners DSM 13335 TaxID=525328 RepID=C8PBJ6_9LACO|nr:hypothetical protein HMPREF0520_0466 [Lactobacillus iners DSM 13335]EFO66449.1 hypothetical protein HMPREF9214_1375 [Lactobacillus iners LactinV 11V1-d]EFO69278.1 hypothetical protein HMPREF9212_1499 [Lactobacillus iners LactinV 03V1-b]
MYDQLDIIYLSSIEGTGNKTIILVRVGMPIYQHLTGTKTT